MITTGVNEDGHREILGVGIFAGEGGAGVQSFLRKLVARRLSGVKLVILDVHSV